MKQKAMFALLLAATTLQVSAQTGETPVEEKKLTLVSDLKLCGYRISQYQWADQEGAESNGFNIRMARISLEGRALTDFYWKAQIQFNGNTATLGASPRVVDVFAEWQKFKPFRVKLGQFKRSSYLKFDIPRKKRQGRFNCEPPKVHCERGRQNCLHRKRQSEIKMHR